MSSASTNQPSVPTHVVVVQDDTSLKATCSDRVSNPRCATQEPCGCPVPRRPATEDDYEEVLDSAYAQTACSATGLSHTYDPEFTGEMVAPTGRCWVEEMAGDLDAADLGSPPPGTYPVDWRNEDNELVVTLAVVASAGQIELT